MFIALFICLLFSSSFASKIRQSKHIGRNDTDLNAQPLCCLLLNNIIKSSLQYGFSSPFVGMGTLGSNYYIGSYGAGLGGFNGYGGMYGMGGMGNYGGFGSGCGTGCGYGYGAQMQMEPVATLSYATVPVVSYSVMPTYSLSSNYGCGSLAGANMGMYNMGGLGYGFGGGYGSYGNCGYGIGTGGMGMTSYGMQMPVVGSVVSSGYTTSMPMMASGFGYGSCIC